MRYISPTFLDSFAYYLSIEDKEKSDEARQGLLNRLRGVKTPPTEAMQRGIDFETHVYKALSENYRTGTYDEWLDELHKTPWTRQVHDIVTYISKRRSGAYIQVPIEKKITEELKVVGYIDLLSRDTIYDIKTTETYEMGKYRNNHQHLAYLYWGTTRRIRKFVYLVMDFKHGIVTTEAYHWRDSMLLTLRASIAKFAGYLLNDEEMHEAWINRTQSFFLEDEKELS